MKKFKAHSDRVLQLMVNSIYTNKEIFLRELISNASDALDKCRFLSLTDSSVNGEFRIGIAIDKDNRTITISDSGIGMTEADLENNLGIIAESGTEKFKKLNQTEDKLIGQFGVGFYSGFMVADKITVVTRHALSTEAFKWESDSSGYTITSAQKDNRGTDITLHLKKSDEDFDYDQFLSSVEINSLIKRYSDYIRYPIYMDIERTTEVDGEWKTSVENSVVNSMTPVWKMGKEAGKEQTDEFYKNTYFDALPPLETVSVKLEGGVTFSALLFIPQKAPYDYYSAEYARGLTLYGSGVMIMESCKQLLPDYLGFVKGVVDCDELNLNISREMLQKTRQLDFMAKSIEKKILSVLAKLLKERREDYEKLFTEFGAGIKYGIYSGFGAKKDELKDLCLFYSSTQKKLVSLKEYTERMGEGANILYAAGTDLAAIQRLPVVQAFMQKGTEVLLLTDHIDEFVMRILNKYDDKPIKSVMDKDVALNDTAEQSADNGAISRVKAALGDRVSDVVASNKLPDTCAAFVTSGSDISLEMEKVLSQVNKNADFKAKRVLELNPNHPVYAKLSDMDDDKLKSASIILLNQALLLAGVALDDIDGFTTAINTLL